MKNESLFTIPLRGIVNATPGENISAFIASNVILEKSIKVVELYFTAYITSVASVRRLPKYYDITIQPSGISFAFINKQPFQITPLSGSFAEYNYLYGGFPQGSDTSINFENVDNIIPANSTMSFFANFADTFAASEIITYYMLIKGIEI